MNPWLSLPLGDYEGHMGSPAVAQLGPLARLFGDALARFRPLSVAVLGVAGGNGLEHIDRTVTTRVLGIDINPAYLDATRQRYPDLPGLELHCLDIGSGAVALEPVSLVHAGLVFEHTGIDRPLDNAAALVAPGGHLSVVLQVPSEASSAVGESGYASMASLADGFSFVDPHQLRRRLSQQGFRLVFQTRVALPAGKALWSGHFERGG